MTANQALAVYTFEDSAVPGTEVFIRWTAGGHHFGGRGTVVKQNRKSFRVRLTEEVECYGGNYLVGREIVAPSITNIREWSVNNRIEPIGGFPEVD